MAQQDPSNGRFTGKVTSQNTAAKKKHVLEKIAEGRTYSDACRVAEVSKRTFDNWRQRDEKFALDVVAADGAARDNLVDHFQSIIFDTTGYWPPRDRLLAAMFVLKQKDPTFRENHKVEHVASGDLQKALKAFTKLGQE